VQKETDSGGWLGRFLQLIAARSVKLPGVLGRIVLLRKVGNKNKKGNVLLKAINELESVPSPFGSPQGEGASSVWWSGVVNTLLPGAKGN
jgi:hypothetical protein